QADAEELIKKIYKDEYAKPGNKAKLELAEALLKDARDTNDSPAAKFVLQREARDLAARSGNLFLALAAADEMSRDFDIETGAASVSAFTLAAGAVATPEQAADVAELILDSLRETLAADGFDAAAKLAGAAEKAARKGGLPTLLAAIQKQRQEIEVLSAELTKVKPLLEKLKDNAVIPGDAK